MSNENDKSVFRGTMYVFAYISEYTKDVMIRADFDENYIPKNARIVYQRDVEIPLPPELVTYESLVPVAIEALEVEKTKVQADAEMELVKIQDRINNLLAIDYVEGED